MQCSWEIKGVHYVTEKLITRVLLDFFEISYCFWTRNQGSTWNISVFCLPDIGKIDIILHKFPQHWLEWAGERNLGFPSSSCRTLEPQTYIKGLLDKDPLQLFCFCFFAFGSVSERGREEWRHAEVSSSVTHDLFPPTCWGPACTDPMCSKAALRPPRPHLYRAILGTVHPWKHLIFWAFPKDSCPPFFQTSRAQLLAWWELVTGKQINSTFWLK